MHQQQPMDRVLENGAGRVIVMDEDTPIGMITKRILAQWLHRRS